MLRSHFSSCKALGRGLRVYPCAKGLRGVSPWPKRSRDAFCSSAHAPIHYYPFIADHRTIPQSVLAYHPHRTLKLLGGRAAAVSRSTMSIKAPPSDLPIYPFSSAKEFEAFLDREHTSLPGLYLKIAKKSSGILSVSAAEAIEVALCFGWIDGRANALDNDWWSVRYTPRRPKSIWSQKNVKTVGRLLEEGRMYPAGVAAVDAAKADGRWDRAYAGPATITVPEDLAAALIAESAAASFFESLNKGDRYAVLWRVETASPQSRAKRIEALVQMLAEGKRPGRPDQPVKKPKKNLDMKTNTSKATVKLGPGRRRLGSANPVRDVQATQPRRAGLRSRP